MREPRGPVQPRRFTNIIYIQKRKKAVFAKRECLVSLTTYRRACASMRSTKVQG